MPALRRLIKALALALAFAFGPDPGGCKRIWFRVGGTAGLGSGGLGLRLALAFAFGPDPGLKAFN